MTGFHPPDWAFYLVAGALGMIGLALLYWSMWSDRARGRTRCPKCWYDMSGTGGLMCPECGHDAAKPENLRRSHRRPVIAFLSVLLLFGSLIGFAAPTALQVGAARLVPTTVLIGISTLLGKSTPDWAAAEIAFRLNDLRGWDWQRAAMIRGLVPRIVHFRSRWPEGVPFRYEMLDWTNPNLWSYQVVGQVVYPDRSFKRSDMESGEFGHPISHEPVWHDRTTNIGILPAGENRIKFERPVQRAQFDPADSFTCSVVVGGTIDGIVRPCAESSLTAAVQRTLELRFITLPTSRRPCIMVRRGPVEDLQVGVTLALRIELLYQGELVGFARGWLPRAESASSEQAIQPSDPWLLSAWKPIDTADPGYSIRVSGDGEMALRDFESDRYWAGSFTVPLASLVKEPASCTPTPFYGTGVELSGTVGR